MGLCKVFFYKMKLKRLASFKRNYKMEIPPLINHSHQSEYSNCFLKSEKKKTKRKIHLLTHKIYQVKQKLRHIASAKTKS